MNPNILIREIGPGADKTYRILDSSSLRNYELLLGRIYEFYLIVDEKLSLPPIVMDTRPDEVQHMLPQLMTSVRTSLREKFISILSKDDSAKFSISKRSFPVIIETGNNDKTIILSSLSILFRDINFDEQNFTYILYPLSENRFNTNQYVHIQRRKMNKKLKNGSTVITVLVTTITVHNTSKEDKKHELNEVEMENIQTIISHHLHTILGKLLF